MKIGSSHLLDNLSNCLMNLKNSGESTGFEPMTSAMPVQCSNQMSYQVTQLREGQFVGPMFSRERNVVWKKWHFFHIIIVRKLDRFLQPRIGWAVFSLHAVYSTILTGGKAVVPVNEAYSWNTSCGFGPSMTNTSIMPLSDIQWVSTCGTSSASLKNDISEFNIDWKTKGERNTYGLSKQFSYWHWLL